MSKTIYRLNLKQKLEVIDWLASKPVNKLTVEEACKEASEALGFPLTEGVMRPLAKAKDLHFRIVRKSNPENATKARKAKAEKRKGKHLASDDPNWVPDRIRITALATAKLHEAVVNLYQAFELPFPTDSKDVFGSLKKVANGVRVD